MTELKSAPQVVHTEVMKKFHLACVAVMGLSLLVGCSDPSGGGKLVAEFHASGQKKFEGYQLEDGTKVGHWTHWHENGLKKLEGEFKNGAEEGRWTGWHENGQKSGEGEYKFGKQEGLWTAWYENGNKAGVGGYRNGKREGRWTIWKGDGAVHDKLSGIFEAGERVADSPKK